MKRALSRACVAAALMGAAFASLSAQTFTNNDPVLKRIWDLGMNQSKVWELSQALMDSVGPRLQASPGAKSASEWIIGKYKAWGIDAKPENYGTWRSWDRGYMHFDLVKPRVHSMDAMLLPWSPGTGGKDVTGSTVLIPVVKDSNEFLKWLPNVKGKFVLMSPNRATCRPHSVWVELAPADEVARLDSLTAKLTADFNARTASTGMGGRGGRGGRGGADSAAAGRGGRGVAVGPPPLSLNDRLEMAGAAGIVTTTAGADAWGTYTVGQTHNKKTPAITMSCEDYTLLFRMTEQNQSPVVRLNSDAKPLGTVPVYNTIATVKGSTRPNEYVMLSAHFDSWDAGTGATDNGTGTVVMLEAMRILRQVYPNPKRTIIAGHWVGEEQGLYGSQAYTADHPEIVKSLHALFNQDNGTGRIQSTSGAGLFDGGKHMQNWLAQLPKEFQDQIRYSGVGGPATGGTDHASFNCYGAPGFGLSSATWDYNGYTHHTNRDTFDKVVFDEVKGNATIVAMLVYLASEDPTNIDLTRRDLTQPDPTATGGGRGGGRGGRGGRGADPNAVAGRIVRVGDSLTVTFTLPVAGAGGRGADSAAAGGRGARGGAGARGGGGGGRNVDAMGWPATCPKAMRASPDTAR